MHFTETIHCPNCSERKEIDIEIYQDGSDVYSDICWDVPRFIKCEECKFIFKVDMNISVSIELDDDLSDDDLEEYKEYCEEDED